MIHALQAAVGDALGYLVVVLLLLVSYLVYEIRKLKSVTSTVPKSKQKTSTQPSSSANRKMSESNSWSRLFGYEQGDDEVTWGQEKRCVEVPIPDSSWETDYVYTHLYLTCSFGDQHLRFVEGGEVELMRDHLGMMFIIQTIDEVRRLYVVHPARPTEAQLISEVSKDTTIKPHSLYRAHAKDLPKDGFYHSMSPLAYLRGPNGSTLHRIDVKDGQASLNIVDGFQLEMLFSMPLKDAVENILDLPDGAAIELWNELSKPDALEVLFSVKDTNKKKFSDVDVYQFELTATGYTLRCLFEGCESFFEHEDTRLYHIKTSSTITIFDRLTGQPIIADVLTDAGWTWDSTMMKDRRRFVIMGKDKQGPFIHCDGERKSLSASVSLIEARIINDETYYALQERGPGTQPSFTIHEFSTQKQIAKFNQYPFLLRVTIADPMANLDADIEELDDADDGDIEDDDETSGEQLKQEPPPTVHRLNIRLMKG